MAKVTGEVEGVSTKYGKYSILVNGAWYGTKEEWAKVKPNKGDNVEFDDGGGKFTKNLKIVDAGGGGSETASTSPAPYRGGSKGVFPIPLEDGQRSIIRQNALTNARELVGATIKSTGKFNKEETITLIIDIAREFEAFTAGDIERRAAEQAEGDMEEGFEVE